MPGALYPPAFELQCALEGGYSSQDNGRGPVNCGLTQRTWDGIRARSGTLADAFTLSELTVSWAGGGSNQTAIEVEDADVFFDHVTVEGSAGYGLATA